MADLPLADISRAIEAGGADWTAAENYLTALPDEERRMRLGVSLFDLPDEQDVKVGNPGSLPAPPTAIDLRNVVGKNYIGPVRDQANCGSCVAFGVVATIEGSACFKRSKPPATFDLSEADLFYCKGGPNGASCDTGWLPSRALTFCTAPGLVDERCFPYLPGNQPCRLCADAATRRFPIVSSTALTAQPTAIKSWVAQNGPVIACFIVYDDFFSYRSGVYKHVTGNQAGGHCVSIVGFNDQQGCWICKNSWRSSWGDLGFFRIAYGQCRIESWENYGVIV